MSVPRILTVDDDATGRYVTTRLLEHAGYSVTEAGTGADALRLCAEQPPDLVILDVNLPDMSGFEVARQLKSAAATAAIPILHLSATATDSASVTEGLDSGADAYLVQPQDSAVLLATVRALLRARAAEVALQRYHLLAEGARDIILVLRADGRIIEANAAAERAYGYSRDELLSRHIGDLRAVASEHDIPEQIEAAGEPGLTFETTHRRRDGTSFPVEVSSRGMELGGERVVLSIIRDSSERKRAEAEREALHAELESQRDLLDAIVEYLPAGIIIAEAPSGQVVRVNRQAMRLTGGSVAPATRIGRYPRLHVYHPDGSEFELDDWQSVRALRTGRVVPPEETVMERSDGTRRTVLASAAPIRGARGAVVAAVVVLSDITDRKRMEEDLRKREAVLAQAGEMARLGAWDIELHDPHDVNANPLTWSAEVYRIFGYEPDTVEVTNDLFFQHVHPDDRQAVTDALAEAIARREPYHIEHRVVRPDGSERIVREHAEITFGEDGQPTRIVGAVQDITERRQAALERERLQKQLLAAERARAEVAEQMTAEINHRMKNNLTLLSGVLEMQAMSLPDGSAPAIALRDAITRLTALSVIHEQLYEAGTARVEVRSILWRIASVDTQALAVSDAFLSVTGDEVYVSSKLGSSLALLANELIANALRHGAPGPDGKRAIEISLSHQADGLRLRVWSSGNPVPADFDLATSTGLGLALVEGVVSRQLNGTLTLRSERGGTMVEIAVPEQVVVATDFVPSGDGAAAHELRRTA